MPIPLFFVAGAAVSKATAMLLGAGAVSGAGSLAVTAYKATQSSNTGAGSASNTQERDTAITKANQEAVIRQGAESLRCLHTRFGLEMNVDDCELHRRLGQVMSSGVWCDSLVTKPEMLPEHQKLMARDKELDEEIARLEWKRSFLNRL